MVDHLLCRQTLITPSTYRLRRLLEAEYPLVSISCLDDTIRAEDDIILRLQAPSIAL